MGIQLAVAPSIKGPGLYLTADLLAGASSPGTASQKAVVIAPRSTAGNLTVDTEVRRAGGVADGSVAFGIGTPGHLAVQRFFELNPTGILDMIAPTASAGASATGTITFSAGPVTSTYNVLITICGRQISVPWVAGEVLADIQTRAVAYINQQSSNLPVTASAGGAGVVTLTFKVPGPWGNDVLYSCVLQSGAGAAVAVANSGVFSGGTTEPDFSTALATIGNTKYDFYIPCVSNADAQSASATSNPGRVKTKINSLNTGLNAKLQQSVFGLTGSLASAKTGAIARNEPTMVYVECVNGQSLPCEWAAAECADRMAKIAIRASVNRIGAPYPYCFGSANLVADTPTAANIEDALGNGVAIVSYDNTGTPIMVRPITTHSQDTLGNPDSRVLDTSGVDGIYAVGNDLEIALPQEFKGASIAPDPTPGDEPYPAGVVSPADIKTFLITRLRFWQRTGVVRKDLLDAAIAAGTVIVQINPSDGSQVDIAVPLGIVRPLAKFGVYLQKVA